MSSNPKVRKTTSNPRTDKPTKRFKANLAQLDTYSSTIALNQMLMTHAKEQYESRKTTHIKTA